MESIGKLTVSVMILAFAGVVNSYVIYKLWGWVLTASFGIASIDMATAFGLSIIILLPHRHAYRKHPEDDRSFGRKTQDEIIYVIVRGCFFLFFGFIASILIR